MGSSAATTRLRPYAIPPRPLLSPCGCIVMWSASRLCRCVSVTTIVGAASTRLGAASTSPALGTLVSPLVHIVRTHDRCGSCASTTLRVALARALRCTASRLPVAHLAGRRELDGHMGARAKRVGERLWRRLRLPRLGAFAGAPAASCSTYFLARLHDSCTSVHSGKCCWLVGKLGLV